MRMDRGFESRVPDLLRSKFLQICARAHAHTRECGCVRMCLRVYQK